MGSRITRSVFRDERSRPIQKSRVAAVRQITAVFLLFVGCLTCFLLGTLHRQATLLSKIITLVMPAAYYIWSHKSHKSAAAVTVVSGLVLFLLILIAKIVGSRFITGPNLFSSFLVLFASRLAMEASSDPQKYMTALWSLYQAHTIGLLLAQHITESSKVEKEGLAQILFSLVGAMGSYLLAMGTRQLTRHSDNNQTVQRSLSIQSLLIATVLIYCNKMSMPQDIMSNAGILPVTLVVLALWYNLGWGSKLWVAVAAFSMIAVLSELILETSGQVSVVSRAISATLATIDGCTCIINQKSSKLSVFWLPLGFFVIECIARQLPLFLGPLPLWLLLLALYTTLIVMRNRREHQYQSIVV